MSRKNYILIITLVLGFSLVYEIGEFYFSKGTKFSTLPTRKQWRERVSVY